MIERHRRIKGATGELTAATAKHYHDLRGPRGPGGQGAIGTFDWESSPRGGA